MSDGGGLRLEALLERRSRRLRVIVLGVALGCSLGILVYAGFRLIPPHPFGLADDYRVFYSAAKLLTAGHNPYATRGLEAVEQAVYHYPHLQPTLDSFAYLPITATVMVPLSQLPFWVSYALYSALGLVVAGLVISLLARDLGWRHDRLLVGAVVVSWVTVLGFVSGQFDALMLAVVAGAMLLGWRQHPLPSGLVMGLVWLKPDLLWPAPIFLFLALWPQRRSAARFALGFALTSTGCLAAYPGLLPAWWSAALGFSRTVGVSQPDLAGLPSLAGAAPAGWRLASGLTAPGSLAVAAIALAAMAVFAAWMMLSPDWRRLTPVGRIAWGVALPLGIWLVATPYAHTNDDLLLLPLLMLTVGRDARRVHGLGLWLSLAVVALVLLTWPGGLVPWEVATAAAILLGAAVWRRRTDPLLTGFGAGLAVLAMALLPPVSPFHLLQVALTPLAAAAVLVEGCRTCWMEVGGAGTGPAYASEPHLGIASSAVGG